MKPTGNVDDLGRKEYSNGFDATTTYLTDDQAAQMGLETPDMTATEMFVPEPAPIVAPPPLVPMTPTPVSLGLGNLGGGPLNLNPDPSLPVAPITPGPITPAMSAPTVDYIVPPGADLLDTGMSPEVRTPPPDQMATLNESQRTSKEVSPEVLRAQNNAVDAALKANEAMSLAEVAKSNAETDAATQKSVLINKQLEAEAAEQAKVQARVDARQAKLDAMGEEYAGLKIDSNRFWADKSTGEKILAGLAIGLGGYGGGPNVALENFQRAIDRDIEIQKANIAQKGANISQQRGMFTDFLKKTDNEQEARLKTYSMGLAGLLAQTDALIAGTNSPIIKSKGEATRAMILQKKVDNDVALADVVVTSAKDVPVIIKKEEDPKALQDLSSAFAKDHAAWSNTGKKAALKSASDIRRAIDKMKTSPEMTGRLKSLLPDVLRSREFIAVRDLMGRAQQALLKDTLGSQFTQAEGERIMGFSFNTALDVEENLNTALSLVEGLESRIREQEVKSSYMIDNNYSLRGWEKSPQFKNANKDLGFKPN